MNNENNGLNPNIEPQNNIDSSTSNAFTQKPQLDATIEMPSIAIQNTNSTNSAEPITNHNVENPIIESQNNINMVQPTVEPIGPMNVGLPTIEPQNNLNMVQPTVEPIGPMNVEVPTIEPQNNLNMVQPTVEPIEPMNVEVPTIEPQNNLNMVQPTVEPIGPMNVGMPTIEPQNNLNMVQPTVEQIEPMNVGMPTIEPQNNLNMVQPTVEQIEPMNVGMPTIEPQNSLNSGISNGSNSMHQPSVKESKNKSTVIILIALGISAVIITVCVLMLTGVLGGKTLTCTISETEDDIKMKQELKVKYKNDKLSNVALEMSVSSDDLGEYKDLYIEMLEEQLESFEDEGLKGKVITNDTSITLNVTASEEKIETILDSDIKTYDEVKEYFEDEGFTCK